MSARAFFGVLLVAVGGGLLLDRAGLLDFGQLLATWWPMILILIAAIQIGTRSAPLPGSLIVLGIGLVFQAIALGFLPANTWAYLWPLVLVSVGLWLIIARGRVASPTLETDDVLSSFVAFGGANPRSESQEFRSGSVTAVFGGTELDLRGAQLSAEGADLEINAAFGGVEVMVPTEWRVSMTGLPIFGGWENKTQLASEADSPGPMLKIHCFVAFGGIEVHN